MDMNDFEAPQDTPGGLGALHKPKTDKPKAKSGSAGTDRPAAARVSAEKTFAQMSPAEFRAWIDSQPPERSEAITDRFVKHMSRKDPLAGILPDGDPLRKASVEQIFASNEEDVFRVIGKFMAVTEEAAARKVALSAERAAAERDIPEGKAGPVDGTSSMTARPAKSEAGKTTASSAPQGESDPGEDYGMTDVESRAMSRLSASSGMSVSAILTAFDRARRRLAEDNYSADALNEEDHRIGEAILELGQEDVATINGLVDRVFPDLARTTDPFEGSPSTPGVSDDAGPATIYETPEQREAADAILSGRSGLCVMECGDNPKADVVPAPVETHGQMLDRLGFPPRPRLWPVMMTWPPQRDLDMLQGEEITGEMRKQYISGLLAKQGPMMDRAERIDRYIKENDPRFRSRTAVKRVTDALTSKLRSTRHPWEGFDIENEPDPYRGIRWATLLDETQTAAVSHMVASWGHQSAMTVDGSQMFVSRDEIKFGHGRRDINHISDTAIQLGLREGISRGWKTFRMRGTPDFALRAAKLARAANVQAEIVYNIGPLGLPPRRKITVMPTPPADPQIARDTDPRAITDQAGTAPTTPHHRQAESDAEGDRRKKQPIQVSESGSRVQDDPNVSAFDA